MIGLLALGVTAVLGVGACLVWTWSQQAARDLAPPPDVEPATEDILRRQVEIHQLEKDRLATGAQILFGFAVLAGLVLTWLRIRVTDRQADAALQNAKTAQKQAQTAQDQMKLARRQQTAERFTKAVEQLGHDKLNIRLGGIYALEKIARDEPVEYFNLFREVLSAFVRESAQTFRGTDDDGEFIPPHTDLQAALTVLGRYPSPTEVEEPARIDWSGAHLERAKLDTAHLGGANLTGGHLEGAILVQTHLEGAFLHEAHLDSAHLRGAHLGFARLREARLEGADLSGAHLEGASFFGANLRKAKLWSARLEDANLFYAHLEGARYNQHTRFPEGFEPLDEMCYEQMLYKGIHLRRPR